MIMNIKVFIKNLLFVCLLLQISLSALAQKKPFEAEIKAFAKSADNFNIFSLQMPSNIVSLNKHSVRNSFKTAEANRENVMAHS